MKHLWSVSKMFFDLVPYVLPHVARRDGAFLLVVPDIHPEVMFLNEPAQFAFARCDGKRTVRDVLEQYMVEYLRADRNTVAYEVVRVLRELESRLAIVLLQPDEAVALRGP